MKIPEKIEMGKRYPDLFISADDKHDGTASSPKFALEIVKRYNAYADQQALIEQLEKRLERIPTGQVCPKCGEIFETAMGRKGVIKISKED